MPNTVTIEPTIFENARTGEKTYGYRIYDDTEAFYNNNLKSIPDDDLDVLEEALQDNNARYMFEFIKEYQRGVEIGGIYYEWEEIKELF